MFGLSHEFRTPASRANGVIFASGHSGRRYSADFLQRSRLDERQIRLSEDAFVDQLFESVPLLGAGFLLAHAPRAFLDVNRPETDLDPAVIEGITSAVLNARVASGLGVIPRLVAPGVPIYEGKISRAEALARLEGIWRPYHAELRQRLHEMHKACGYAVLLDCHSMPSVSSPEAEIVLGDRYGMSCDPILREEAFRAFEAEGFRVLCNRPYAGGYVTQTYGRPSQGVHALQIEIRRDLYMDERKVTPLDSFKQVQQRLMRVMSDLIACRLPQRGDCALSPVVK